MIQGHLFRRGLAESRRSSSVVIYTKEIQAVQATAPSPEDIIVVRLFVLEKVLFGLGARRWTASCGVVEKCPNIQRIELEALAGHYLPRKCRSRRGGWAMVQALGRQVMASGGKLVADSGRN